MKGLTLAELRKYRELGVVSSVELIRAPMCDGRWFIAVSGTSGSSWFVATARGDLRVFASVDTALGVLYDCGFPVSSLSVFGGR